MLTSEADRRCQPGPHIVDVGTGTGVAARQFRAAGCTVLGVEPDARMADFARRSGVEVEVATFEAWDPAGREFDAIVAGQAWHWVDPVAGAAKAAQVLRPSGRLAAIWHVGQPPPEAAEAFAAVYRRVMPDSPLNLAAASESAVDGYQVLFTTAAVGIREVGGFSDSEQWRFDRERSYTRAEWLDQLPTSGALTRLSSDKLAEVLSGVGAAIEAIGGSFTMRYATVAVTATRTQGVAAASVAPAIGPASSTAARTSDTVAARASSTGVERTTALHSDAGPLPLPRPTRPTRPGPAGPSTRTVGASLPPRGPAPPCGDQERYTPSATTAGAAARLAHVATAGRSHPDATGEAQRGIHRGLRADRYP